jgi:multidrug efflux pump subunit AcrA (membrane-fusion protein)
MTQENSADRVADAAEISTDPSGVASRIAPSRVATTFRQIFREWSFRGESNWLFFIVLVTAVVILAVMAGAVVPGYTHSTARTYTSRFGYPELLRMRGKPFPVVTARTEQRTLSRAYLGEGVMRSEPVLVPILSVGRVMNVKVTAGDRVSKGQLIAEVDPNRARINLEAARAAVKTAQAEAERTTIGSSYIGRFERPRLEAIGLKMAKQEVDLQGQLLTIWRRLQGKGFTARFQIVQSLILLVAAQLQSELSEAQLDMAEKGLVQSKRIAQEAIRTAELALELRQSELEGCKVYAPFDCTVERCLVHEGEYNAAPGNPGFLVAAGMWFEAQFDQASYNQFHTGDPVEVRLEALTGRPLSGRVARIVPFVSYNLGGPETTRPVRPLGTGAPEWPATYAVRVDVGDDPTSRSWPLINGLTGFGKVALNTQATAIPRSAVISVSGQSGMVYVVRGDRFEPRQVTVGIVDGEWAEIREGLGPNDEVIIDGHFALMPDDRIVVSKRIDGGR